MTSSTDNLSNRTSEKKKGALYRDEKHVESHDPLENEPRGEEE